MLSTIFILFHNCFLTFYTVSELFPVFILFQNCFLVKKILFPNHFYTVSYRFSDTFFLIVL